ncbi:MAG: hypothetical protein EKK42_26595 [Pseudonocardiaceae bacterium]|nr:MAG: hypothetical protein EKK42_26595 [Pseudonocardiaceae bacterium]
MTLALQVLREIAATYLVFTLVTTGLAKFKTRWVTAGGIASERVIPRAYAMPVTVALIVVELGLATVLTVGVAPYVVGLLLAVLFTAFGLYKLRVGLKLGSGSCSCAGQQRMSYAATPSGLAAATLSSAMQAGLALLCAFAPPNADILFRIGPVIALAVPIAFFVKGLARTSHAHWGQRQEGLQAASAGGSHGDPAHTA